MTWPQVSDLYSVPDLGDPLFSIWRIAWVSHQLPRNPLALFDANIFYPERLTFTYSDSLIVPALMAAPPLWLGMHPVVVYNVLLLPASCCPGVTTFLLVRALTGRVDAAIVSGAIFALYPFGYEHYSHLELQMTMWMPLALWSLHRTIAQGRLRDGLLTGLAFALQMLSSLYYGVFLSVYMVGLGVVLWIGRGLPRRPLFTLAAGALVAGCARRAGGGAVPREQADDGRSGSQHGPVSTARKEPTTSGRIRGAGPIANGALTENPSDSSFPRYPGRPLGDRALAAVVGRAHRIHRRARGRPSTDHWD